jgi:large subunit ribosomal protein L20
MARVKNSKNSRAHRKTILSRTKGYIGGRNNRLRQAQETLKRAGNYAFRDRKQKKRNARGLWIVRINAAARENGVSYSRLMSALKVAGVVLDRKALAELAVSDPAAFTRLAQLAQKA